MTGLYIHIPFCTSKCRYCAFYSEPVTKHNPSVLVSALIKQLDSYDLADIIKTVYIGGGSPTCIPADELFRLTGHIAKKCPKIIEFTLEANPAQITRDLLNGLIARKVNRLSIGAQSFIDSELKFLGRTHSARSIQTGFEIARQAGFTNISLDLIFAICGSKIDNFKYSLQKAIALEPEHISAYSLSIEPDTEFARAFARKEITPTDQQTDREMYELAIEKFESAGLKQYEISNFAKTGRECKHNQSCWSNDEYIGVGPAAASYYNGVRYNNIADIKNFIEKINSDRSVISESHTPDKTEIACETAVLNLRTRRGVNLADFAKKTGFEFKEIFAGSIEKNLKEGLLEFPKDHPGNIRLTRNALAIADKILSDFAAL